jgi:hypothetical protein
MPVKWVESFSALLHTVQSIRFQVTLISVLLDTACNGHCAKTVPFRRACCKTVPCTRKNIHFQVFRD